MIRKDFVSNSSSSSYIISTKESQNDLIDYIVKGAYKNKPDENGHVGYWHGSWDECNREFLEIHMNHYVQLVIGDFEIFGNRSYSMEEAEENAEKKMDPCNCVIKVSDMEKFVKDGKVVISYDDFRNGNCPKFYYSSYRVFEITRDSITFTRWLKQFCANDNNNQDWKNLGDFYKSLPEEIRKRIVEIPEDIRKKWLDLSEKCHGLLIEPNCHYRIQNEKGEWISVSKPIDTLLDKYEKMLDEGKRIYRICFGTSGEGQDWDSYVWYEDGEFLRGNDKFTFEYDCFW